MYEIYRNEKGIFRDSNPKSFSAASRYANHCMKALSLGLDPINDFLANAGD